MGDASAGATGPDRGPDRGRDRGRDRGGDDLARAARQVGDRWTLQVVDALRAGPLRYGELAERLDGIAPNVLARRLRDLEAGGLVVASPYQQRPLRFRYELTGAGRELAGALSLLRQWGAARRGGGAELHHGRCGGALELRLWCPTCGTVVDPDHEGHDGDDLVRL